MSGSDSVNLSAGERPATDDTAIDYEWFLKAMDWILSDEYRQKLEWLEKELKDIGRELDRIGRGIAELERDVELYKACIRRLQRVDE